MAVCELFLAKLIYLISPGCDKLKEALNKLVTSMGTITVVAMKSVPPRGSGWVVDTNQTR
jgi:hypothetical protein